MNTNVVNQITQLLSQAGSAHHQYEQTVLKGVYDQDWPTWYALYVINHGLGTVLGQPVTEAQLSRFFTESYTIYKKGNPKEGWVNYTARQIAENWRNQ